MFSQSGCFVYKDKNWFRRVGNDEAPDNASQEEKEHQRFMLNTELDRAFTDQVKKNGIGWQTREQWQGMADMLLQFQVLKKPADVPSVFDDTALKVGAARGPRRRRPVAGAARAPIRAAGTIRSRRDLDHHVGRLDDADDLLAGSQLELVGRLARDQADQPVRAREDLDRGRRRILPHGGHDTREPVPRALGDDRTVPALPTTLCPAPFAAFNCHLREEVGFGGNVVLQAGWQWRGANGGHLLRTGMEYFNGKSPQFEFFDESEQRLGVGLWYDF